tara:strand:- start:218 stop:499 length:282 start_codon:yes stop_codon:yes gene_type:complete
MPLNCAILDDYQNVAMKCANWSKILPDVAVSAFHDTVSGKALAERLSSFDIIVAMRERTRFDADLLAELPRLRLLVTTGMKNASIDMTAAASM